MSTVHIFVKAFKHCAKANFEFKESEEAQGGNVSTLAADSGFHELSDPENSGAGSPWQRHASLWMPILFSWGDLAAFFCNRHPKSKDLDLLIPKTEIVTSRTGVTSLVRRKNKLTIIILSSSAWPGQYIFLLVLVNRDTDFKYYTRSTSVSSFPRTQELIQSQVIFVSVDSAMSWEFQQRSIFFQIAFFLAMFSKAQNGEMCSFSYITSVTSKLNFFCQFCCQTESLYLEASQKFSVYLDITWLFQTIVSFIQNTV